MKQDLHEMALPASIVLKFGQMKTPCYSAAEATTMGTYCGRWVIGPYVLPRRLTGAVYNNFLVNGLRELTEDIPLWVQNHVVQA
jgi:hypothetical protein